MKVSDIDLDIKSKELFYNGSGYRARYGLATDMVEAQSSQKFIVKIPSAGFIANGNKIENFYMHNGEGFDTWPKVSFHPITEEMYEDFKKALKS